MQIEAFIGRSRSKLFGVEHLVFKSVCQLSIGKTHLDFIEKSGNSFPCHL
jgi:hypothetical protein